MMKNKGRKLPTRNELHVFYDSITPFLFLLGNRKYIIILNDCLELYNKTKTPKCLDSKRFIYHFISNSTLAPTINFSILKKYRQQCIKNGLIVVGYFFLSKCHAITKNKSLDLSLENISKF